MPLVQISMASGRDPEKKREMLHAVTKAIHETIGAPIPSIRVWITEFDANDFIAGGEILAERRAREASQQQQ